MNNDLEGANPSSSSSSTIYSWSNWNLEMLGFFFGVPGEIPPGGVFRISSDRDDQRIFWGQKFSIPGFFGVGKFWQIFSWVA